MGGSKQQAASSKQQAASSKQQAAGSSSSSSSKHQQKHNTRYSHTRVMYLTSVTKRSNTKMAVSNSEVVNDEFRKVNDELTEVKTSITMMCDDLKEVNKSMVKMNTKLDRTANRMAWAAEARCREKMSMECKEVKGVYDALSLLFIDTKEAEYDSAKERLVSALYRRCTRDLFLKITGKEWTDEQQALASLNAWRRDANKENNSNGGDTDDDDTDDDDDDYKSYSAPAETVVVESFIKMLAPFDVANVDKKKAHDAAQEILLYDETGLALSLIIASMDDKQDDKGGCWGWKVLKCDGFSHSDDYSPHKINLLEVKCDQSLQKAKEQLDVRTRFIDAVATLAEYNGVKLYISKYAYVDGVYGDNISESVNDYNHISVLRLIIMKIDV
jgi:hypothetical protein